MIDAVFDTNAVLQAATSCDKLTYDTRIRCQLNCDKILKMSSKTLQNAKKNLKVVREITTQRPERKKLSAEESLKRMNDFDKRKDKFVASIREGKV
jgi:hypothetical protein